MARLWSAAGLPTIRQERRKAGGGGGAGGADSEGDGHEDGMVLPPIGGLKGKRDGKNKTQTFKTAANATLQKPALAQHGTMTVHGAMTGSHGSGSQGPNSLGVLGTSKGLAGTMSSAAGAGTTTMSTDAMSSTNPHSWAGTKDQDHMRGVSSGSGGPTVTEKMNSTWAPNHGQVSRRYVSPFGAKMVLGGKKR